MVPRCSTMKAVGVEAATLRTTYLCCCRNFSEASPAYILPCRGAEAQNARATGILSPCSMNAAHRARAGAVTIALGAVSRFVSTATKGQKNKEGGSGGRRG